MGLSSVRAAEAADDRLSFGEMEPLVSLMQETPADKLMPLLVERLGQGTSLRTLIAAGALANARTFAGEDYIGYHSFMALSPAYEMSRELPEAMRPLPVLKVLYRNSSRMQDQGGCKHEHLHRIEPAALPAGRNGGELFRISSDAAMPRGPNARLRPWFKAPSARRISICNMKSRTKSTYTGWCSHGGPGPCSTWPASNMPTRCCDSRCAIAWTKSDAGKRAVGTPRTSATSCPSCSISTSC
jgi:hypothetical protein